MNVVIAGLGSIACKHIQALHNLDIPFIIYALRSGKGSRTVEGVIDIYSLNELQDKKVDFAIVSNPTAEHISTIRLLSDLKCPLFIEKPLSHRPDIEACVTDTVNSGLLTYVACNLRFLDCLQYIKNALAGAEVKVNEVNAYCGSYLPDWRPGTDFRNVYSADASAGGGVHLDLIHELDYLYWLFGMPEQVTSCFGSRSTLGISAYDYANYCLAYPSFHAGVVLNYYRRDARRTLEIVTGKETWEVDLRTNTVKAGNRMVFESSRTIQDTYTAQMDYFVGLVRNRESRSFNTIEDAYNVLKICLANDTRK